MRAVLCNAVLILLLAVAFGEVSVPAALAEQGCTECPATGDCPKKLTLPTLSFGSADKDPKCPCPATGDCPNNMIFFNFPDQLSLLLQRDPDRLLDMQTIGGGTDWEKNVPPALVQTGIVNDRLLAVPVAFDPGNLLWINKGVLREIGLSEDSIATPEGLLDAFDRARQSGRRPFALDTDPGSSQLLFQAIASATGGVESYKGAVLAGDRNAIESPQMLDAFRLYSKIMSDNAVSPGSPFGTAAQMFSSGSTLASFGGSWMLPPSSDPMSRDGDVLCSAFPGDRSIVIADVKLMAVDARQPSDTSSSAYLFPFDRDFDEAFSSANGLLPVRTDSYPGSSPLAKCGGSTATSLGDAAASNSVLPAIWLTPGSDRNAETLASVLSQLASGQLTANDAPEAFVRQLQ